MYHRYHIKGFVTIRSLYLAIFFISTLTFISMLFYFSILWTTDQDIIVSQRDKLVYSECETNRSASRIKRLPKAIIIGSRKSGTRALLRFLALNPAVRTATNEVHFFDRNDNYFRGLDWYRDKMPATKQDEIAVEKTPAYFISKVAPERVMRMDPLIKLIVVLREPVIRLISDHSQLVANRIGTAIENEDDRFILATGGIADGNLKMRESRKDFMALVDEGTDNSNTSNPDIWIEGGEELARHVLTANGRINDQRQIVQAGMYSIYLEKWLSVFPRDSIHIVNGERLIIEPHAELQKLEKFLGLKPVIQSDHFVFVARKKFFCISKRAMCVNNSKEKKRNAQEQGAICLNDNKGRQHVHITGELYTKLRDFYRPYNEYLKSLTGIDFNQ